MEKWYRINNGRDKTVFHGEISNAERISTIYTWPGNIDETGVHAKMS